MSKKFKKFIADNRSGIVILLFLGIYVVLATAFHFSCPFRVLLGVPCGGCGMTRAWLSVLHLDLASAFHYHPAFFVVPAVIFSWFFKNRSPKLYNTVLYVGLGYMLVVYIIRLIIPNDGVIDINVKNGLVFKLLSRIFVSIF